MKKWFIEKNIGLRLLSVVIAIFLWMYVIYLENPQTEVTISGIKPTFQGEEHLQSLGLAVVSGLDTTISLTLRGSRTALAKYGRENIEVTVDLYDITTSGEHRRRYEIASMEGVTVQNSSPSYINLEVDRIVTVSLEPRLVLQGSIAEGFVKDQVTFDPPTIKVSGPENIISTLSHADVVLRRSNLDSTVTEVLPFSIIDQNGYEVRSDSVSSDYEDVKVTVEVLATKEVPLVVELVHGGGTADSNVVYTISPESILISGGATALEGINTITVGKIDLAQVTSANHVASFPIPVPNDVNNLSGLTNAVVELEIKGLETRKVDATTMEVVNLPPGTRAELVTEGLTVTIRGPEGSIQNVEGHNLRVVADLEGQTIGTGQHVVTAKVYVDGFTDVGAIGEYKVTFNLLEDG